MVNVGRYFCPMEHLGFAWNLKIMRPQNESPFAVNQPLDFGVDSFCTGHIIKCFLGGFKHFLCSPLFGGNDPL